MPRDIGTGLYHYPAGTEGNTAQTIFSARYNTFINDLANTLNQELPVNMGGTGADNATEARANLDAEVASTLVTNFDSHVFESGSFHCNASTTGAPTGNPFAGICVVHGNPSYIALTAFDMFAPAPGYRYSRLKNAGVWGPWTREGTTAQIGGNEGVSLETGEMFFGVSGVAPNSAFIVNNQSDVTGVNVFSVGRDGLKPTFKSGALSGIVQLYLDKTTAAGSSSDIVGARATIPRWLMRLGDEIVEPGGNVGSNFSLQRMNDAGTSIGTALAINRADGSAQFGGTLSVTGSVRSVITGTTGTYYFGSSDKFLTYSGTAFAFGGGPVTVNNWISTQETSTTGTIHFGASGTKYLSYNGTNFALSGGNLNVTGGVAAGATSGTLPGFGNVLTGVDMQSAGVLAVSRATAGALLSNINADGINAYLLRSGVAVGSISVTTTATSFNTSSDERLKEDLKSFDAGNIVDDTNVYDFAWKSTGERSFGIIAQQAKDIYPQATLHDVEEDRWFVDYSKYVPVILQELKALRARVAQLEGRLEVKPP